MSDAALAARSDPLDALTAEQIARWEDLLAYVTDPRRPRPSARDDTPGLLSHLLSRAGVDETEFWSFARNRRSRVLRAGYARPCRDVPGLELSAFDIDKLLKERFRHEPLTLGAAWHYGYFRSYFSHAAITHPANDGLREEFSTAWDIVRKRPAVVLRGGEGAARRERLAELSAVRLDLPMIVGPLPYAAGVGLELAYLAAAAGADPAADLRTGTLVVIEADRALPHAAELLPHVAALLVRLAPRHARLLGAGDGESRGDRDGGVAGDGAGQSGGDGHHAADRDALTALLRGARIVELDPWSDGGGGEGSARAARRQRRGRRGDEVEGGEGDEGDAQGGGGELAELAAAALRVATRSCSLCLPALRPGGAPTLPPTRRPGPTGRRSGNVSSSPPAAPSVALLHYRAGPLKSYRLTPRIDAFLKERLLRARVQLVSAGGDSDTQASAATVYESVLLGANGGAMTHAAVIPLVSALVDALAAAGADGSRSDRRGGCSEGAGRALTERALAAVDPAELRDLARCSLSCCAARTSSTFCPAWASTTSRRRRATPWRSP